LKRSKTRNLFFTYQKISKNIKKYQQISKNIKKYQQISKNNKKNQKISKRIKEVPSLEKKGGTNFPENCLSIFYVGKHSSN
jgi:hypothetical protein